MPQTEKHPQGRRLVPEKLEDSDSAGSGTSNGDGTSAGSDAGTGSSSHSKGGKDGKGGQPGKAPPGAKGQQRAARGGFRGGAGIARPEQSSEEERLLLLEEEKVADVAAELERRKVAYTGGFDPFAQIKLGEAVLGAWWGGRSQRLCLYGSAAIMPASLRQLRCSALSGLQPCLSRHTPTSDPTPGRSERDHTEAAEGPGRGNGPHCG